MKNKEKNNKAKNGLRRNITNKNLLVHSSKSKYKCDTELQYLLRKR